MIPSLATPLHLAPPLGVTAFEFCQDLRHQKTKSPWAIVWQCLFILRLAVSVEHRLVTERHTMTAYTVLAWRRVVKMLTHDEFVMVNVYSKESMEYV